jgi:hypothetical protein
MKVFQIFLKPRRRIGLNLDSDGVQNATNLVNRLNGVKDLYRSIYNFQYNYDPQNAIIDKIFLDFDPDKKTGKGAQMHARRMCMILTQKGIKHSAFYSGNGFHVFVYCEPRLASSLKYPSMAIKNFVYELIDESEFRPKIAPDRKVLGDLSRVARIPNTINLKTNLYAIPLKPGYILEAMIKDIKELANKQQFYDPTVEGKLVDLESYDTSRSTATSSAAFDYDIPLEFNETGVPECVKNLLRRGDLDHTERFYVILALRDLAYSLEDVEGILKQYLTEDKYEHSVEEENQVEYLFNREDLMFPRCSTIKQNGYCVIGCPGQTIYYV